MILPGGLRERGRGRPRPIPKLTLIEPFAFQAVGHPVQCVRQTFLKFVLGAADLFGQFKTGEPQAIFDQGDATYEQHAQMWLPAESSTSQRQVLLTGGAEFEPDSVGETPDLVETAVDRFTKSVMPGDRRSDIGGNRLSDDLSQQSKQRNECSAHLNCCGSAP